MEIWIWFTALVAGALIMLMALLTLAFRSISLARMLRPFYERLVRLKTSSEQYPEAMELLTGLVRADQTPAKGQRGPKV
jgi:hypothetical protein